MARRGVAGTTTQDIAKRARCSQAAIYKYWEGKETLARQLFESSHQGLMDAMRAQAAASVAHSERVLGALLGLLRFAREHPDHFAFLFQVFHSDYARWLTSLPKPRDLITEELENAMAADELPARDAAVKAALVLGMAIRLAFFERQGLLGSTPRQAEEALWESAASVLES
jgi:AcrR family transcriptional regulator